MKNRLLARTLAVLLLSVLVIASGFAQQKTIWKIGEADNSPSGMALAPEGYKRFLEKDFGYEDNFFLIGRSEAQKD
ncbi:MAG TPA: hypothetical protein VN038_27045, partial [Dyadobacter sp.]|nr:hypothetical protein [Dyadobacter sp.]